jgi:glucose-6-phosphate-specific signal transduction histidine kinase
VPVATNRLPADVEIAASSRSMLDRERQLVLSVADDGPGGADVNAGTGLRGLIGRWAAVGGELVVDSPVPGSKRTTATDQEGIDVGTVPEH